MQGYYLLQSSTSQNMCGINTINTVCEVYINTNIFIRISLKYKFNNGFKMLQILLLLNKYKQIKFITDKTGVTTFDYHL